MATSKGGTLPWSTRWGAARALPELAVEMVRLGVDIIFAGANAAVKAAMRATRHNSHRHVPGGAIRRLGLVASLARPGGNVTGADMMAPEIIGKRISYSKRSCPGSPGSPSCRTPPSDSRRHLRETEAAARELGLELHLSKRGPQRFRGGIRGCQRSEPERSSPSTMRFHV